MATKHWKWTSTHSFLEMLEKFGLWNSCRNGKKIHLDETQDDLLNKHLVFRCNLDQFNFNIRRISCVNVGENQKNEKNWKTMREMMKKKLKKNRSLPHFDHISVISVPEINLCWARAIRLKNDVKMKCFLHHVNSVFDADLNVIWRALSFSELFSFY